MANVFLIKEKSCIIIVSFRTNARRHIWGYMGGVEQQFVEDKVEITRKISYQRSNVCQSCS